MFYNFTPYGHQLDVQSIFIGNRAFTKSLILDWLHQAFLKHRIDVHTTSVVQNCKTSLGIFTDYSPTARPNHQIPITS